MNFDLAGDIATKVTQSPEQSGMEYCTYQAPEVVCREGVTAKDADSGVSADLEAAILKFGPDYGAGLAPVYYPGCVPGYGYPNPVCHTIWVTRPGSEFVRYYNETTVKDITARFLQKDKNLADYQGRASSTERIYTYKSGCR